MLLGAAHKSRAVELEKQGPDRHSGYSGEPWLGQLLRVSEVSWKVFWEPLLCIAAGLALMWVNYPLGYFIAGGGAALRLKNWLVEHHEREAAADLFDAYYEQQMVAERFRGRK
jgi:hypothetical protein